MKFLKVCVTQFDLGLFRFSSVSYSSFSGKTREIHLNIFVAIETNNSPEFSETILFISSFYFSKYNGIDFNINILLFFLEFSSIRQLSKHFQ